MRRFHSASLALFLAACSNDSAVSGGSDGGPSGAAGGAGIVGGGATSGGGSGMGGGAGASSGGARTGSGGAGGASAGNGGASPGGGGANPGAGGTNPGTGGANPGTGGAAPASVRVVGRTDGNATSPRFEWPGVSIQARFKGTSVTADFDGGNNNYFEVVVDGQTEPRIATTGGRTTISVVSGLPDAVHDLVLWRRTEADNFSPSQFFGLDFGGGTLLPSTPPVHKMEVIGDSITCGYGDEGAGPNCSFSFDTENDYLAYGSVAARALGADLYTEAWSGKGMYRNNDGSMTDTMPTLWGRAIPTDSTSAWDFSWTPDAVVVNLGTNDFAKGDPGQGYVTAYESFLDELRTHYANAWVFVMIGPMTSGNDLTTARGYLDQVVSARKSVGDDRVSQVLIDPQDGTTNGLGCDYHPSTKTHEIVGNALAAAMKSTLGW